MTTQEYIFDLTPEQYKKIKGMLADEKPVNCFERADEEDEYYHINSYGELASTTDLSFETDTLRYKSANYCTNAEMLQQRAFWESLNRQLWRFSMMNGGEKINYNNPSQEKWCIHYNIYDKLFEPMADDDIDFPCGTVCFISEKITKQAISEVLIPFLDNYDKFDPDTM